MIVALALHRTMRLQGNPSAANIRPELCDHARVSHTFPGSLHQLHINQKT